MSPAPETPACPSTLYELLRQGALTPGARRGIGWPRDVDPYDVEKCSIQELYQFCEGMTEQMIKKGLEIIPHDRTEVVALFGPANLEYVITLFSLSRLGYTVLLIAPRHPKSVLSAILDKGNAGLLFYAPSTETVAQEAASGKQISLLPFMERPERKTSLDPARTQIFNCEPATDKVAIIRHTSGSTGHPKLFSLTHREVVERSDPLDRANSTELVTSPAYNPIGFAYLLRSMRKTEVTYFWNENLPYTNYNAVRVLEQIKPNRIGLYPRVLTLLSESPIGIELLRNCTHVTAFGAPVPDSTGDLVLKHKINLRVVYALTETYVLMGYDRSFGDSDWAYLAPLPGRKDHILMAPIDGTKFELVVLKGCPGCKISNSDDPPGSYHTKDLFQKHPTKPNRWKFVCRLDDRLTMANGNNVVTIEFEQIVKNSPLVKEAVAFGMGRAELGLLLFRNEASCNMDDKKFISEVWSFIEDANSQVAVGHRIRQELIVPVETERRYPTSEKGTFARFKVYEEFKEEIEAAYEGAKR